MFSWAGSYFGISLEFVKYIKLMIGFLSTSIGRTFMIVDFVMFFTKKDKGQGLVEYALIILLIALIVIVALTYLAPTIGSVFNNISYTLQSPGVIKWTITATPTP
jgi:pilus assembly protein Flp/PilA